MYHYKCMGKAKAPKPAPKTRQTGGLRLALFNDATCQTQKQRTGIACIAFDVTDPFKPAEVLSYSACLPYMDSTLGEHQAVVQGLEEVIDRITYRGLKATSLSVFTDASAITENLERKRQGKTIRMAGLRQVQVSLAAKLDRLRELGCETTIERIPRKLNRKAHDLAHVAIKNPPTQAIPVVGTVEQRFPFLTILNS